MKAKRSLEARLREAVRDESYRKKLIRRVRNDRRIYWALEMLILAGTAVWVLMLLIEGTRVIEELNTSTLDSMTEWTEKVERQLVYICLLLFAAVPVAVAASGSGSLFGLLVMADEMAAKTEEKPSESQEPDQQASTQ